MLPTEKNNSLMAAFPHISTTNSGLVWFPMATRPWSSSRFQRILGYWCRYWSCSPCLPGFPISSETSENQQYYTQLKYSKFFYNLFFQYICCQVTSVLSIFVDCQLFESLYRWNLVHLFLCVLNKILVFIICWGICIH